MLRYAHMPLARTLSALDACYDRNFLSAARCPLLLLLMSLLQLVLATAATCCVCHLAHPSALVGTRILWPCYDFGVCPEIAASSFALPHTHTLETQLQVGKCVNWVIAAPVKLWLSAFKACALPRFLPSSPSCLRCVRWRTWQPRSASCIHGNFLAAVARQHRVSPRGVVFDCCCC